MLVILLILGKINKIIWMLKGVKVQLVLICTKRMEKVLRLVIYPD